MLLSLKHDIKDIFTSLLYVSDAYRLVDQLNCRPLIIDGCIYARLNAYINSIGRNFDLYNFYTLHGPVTRYVKLGIAHAPGMPGTSCPPSRVSDPDMHHGTCVTHMP